VKSRLDLAVSDLGATQLKNIAEPVRVYSLEVGKAAQAKPTKPAPRKQWPMRALLGARIVALIVVAGGAWYFLGANRPTTVTSKAPATRAEAAHLSIVVLPFTNLSGDPSQDYFADENLTTDLSRIRNSFVIARNTAFTFKGKNIDTKEISKELGVRYVLEGSVQRDQNRVRVNAQLIDGETGTHLWADRFEDEAADLFKLQDQIVARLANALGSELVRAEASKSVLSTNLDAIDLTMRGWALLNVAGREKEPHQQARDLFEHALEIDPQNAKAMVGIALIDTRDFGFSWNLHPERTLADSLGLLNKALAIDPTFSYGYYAKAVALMYALRPTEAVEAARTGTIVDPNSALSFAAMGRAEMMLALVGRAEQMLGRCEESITHVKEAFRLSPRDPQSAFWHFDLGMGDFCRRRFDPAAEEFRRAIDGGLQVFFSYMSLAAAEAILGNDADAKTALAEARRLNPQLTLKWLAEQKRAPYSPEMREGLRKAGLPEE
jgi:adenylate cyclase